SSSVAPSTSGTVQSSSPTTWLTRARTSHSVHGVFRVHCESSTASSRERQLSTLRRCRSASSIFPPGSVSYPRSSYVSQTALARTTLSRDHQAQVETAQGLRSWGVITQH